MQFPTFLLSDPTLGGTPFTVTRKRFSPDDGINITRDSVTCPAFGCVHPASAEELTLVPEEYRHREVIVIYTPFPLSLGSDGGTYTAAPDEIAWNGRTYRLIRLKDFSSLGYVQGYAADMGK